MAHHGGMHIDHKPLILLDQDGPLADFDAGIHAVLASAGLDHTSVRWTDWDYSDDIRRHFGDDAVRLLDDARHEPGFYRSLPVVAGAQEAVERLLDAGCEIAVCTAPDLSNPTCASDKLSWIEEHFSTLVGKVVMANDKTFVRGDVLVDDKPSVQGVMIPSWTHIRFATNGNAHLNDGSELASWSEWDRLLRLVRTPLAFAR